MMAIMVTSALVLCSLFALIAYRFRRLVKLCVNLKLLRAHKKLELKTRLLEEYEIEFHNLFDVAPPASVKLSNFGLKFVSYMSQQEELKFPEGYRAILERRLGNIVETVSKSQLLIECDLRHVSYKRCHDLLCKMEFIYI